MKKLLVKDWIEQEQGKHFCHCSCHGEIIIKKYHHGTYGIPKYINGHRYNDKNSPIYNPKIDKWILEQQGKHFCHCSCHKEIIIKRWQYWKNISQYLPGHQNKENNPKKGKKVSKETRQKMSKNHANFSGKNSSMYGKIGKNNPNYGRKASKETILKQSGKNNSQWMGGISFEPYCYLFNNKLKENIRDRDNRTCQLCNKLESKNKHLSVHHIHYDKENCYPDLIALCVSCNTKVNANRNYWEMFFMRQLCYKKIYIKITDMSNELDIWNYGKF